MKKSLLITSALLLTATASIFAADQMQNKSDQMGNNNRPTFEQLDANSDGTLAKDEVRGRLLANFDHVDTDANGSLSADEFNSRVKVGKQGHKGKHKNRPTFEQLDANSDGMLVKEEVRGRLLANFAQVDTDANGSLSADEFNSRVKMGKQGHKGKHKNRPTFEQLDTNADGSISAEEFNAAKA
ncbi:EF-hand domain-containing protein [Psychromonas sp.]|uniref:EF-hand domain-containing protein n=1 Tax=Psychromonas sp. TaxID=1884585 RepID=UPI00356843A9